MKTFTTQFLLSAALLAPAVLSAQTAYTEGLINLPNGAAQASGIDDDNEIVGAFYDSSNVSHGFLWSSGVVAQIDEPGAQSTAAVGINSKTGIVGYYSTGGSNVTALLDAKRRFGRVKGGSGKYILGINATGSFVGFEDSGAGFININGTYTTVKPDICHSLEAPVSTYVVGLNSKNDFVGFCVGQNGVQSLGFANVSGVYQPGVALMLDKPSGI